MLYADDAGVVSKFADGVARMMTIIVEVLREFGLTVLERKTETLLMQVKDKQPASPPPPLTTEAAGEGGAKVGIDDRVPILGRPRQRAGQPYARDQRQEQSGVGVLQQVRHGALRPARSAVSFQDPHTPGGCGGGTA